jgi:hypothetical protein
VTGRCPICGSALPVGKGRPRAYCRPECAALQHAMNALEYAEDALLACEFEETRAIGKIRARMRLWASARGLAR